MDEDRKAAAGHLIGEGEAAVLGTAQVDHQGMRYPGAVRDLLLAEELEIAVVVQGQHTRERPWHIGRTQ